MSCYTNSYNYTDIDKNMKYDSNDYMQKDQSRSVRQTPMSAQTHKRNMQTRPTDNCTITTGMPILPITNEAPTTVQSPYYTAGFLKRYIGRDMRVEFLIGSTGALVDRVGTLVEVGASYIVLRLYKSDDALMCDLYSIKFVTIYG